MMKRIFASGVIVLLFAAFAQQSVAQRALTLDECKQMALKNDKELSISSEKLEAAKQLKKAAQTQYYPNISASGMYLHNSSNFSLLQHDILLPVGTMRADGKFTVRPDQMANTFVDLGGGVSVPLDASGTPFDPSVHPEKIQFKDYAYIPKEALEMDMKNVFSVGVNLIQPIFMGGKIRELNRIAASSVNLANAQVESARLELVSNVEQAYWQVVSVENKLALAKSYVELLQKMESDVQQLLQEGLATRSDLLMVKVRSNEGQQQLSKAENGLSLAKMFLCKQIGLPISSDIQLAEKEIPMVLLEKNLSRSMPDVFAKRPEIKSLTELTHIAQSAVKIQKSRFLPTVGLTAGWLGVNPNPYNGFSSSMGGAFSVGVAVNVPVFHFGERVYTLRAAEYEKRATEYKLEAVKEMLGLQVEQLSYKVLEAIKRVNTAQKNVDLAQENLRAAEEGFKEGVMKSSDVLMAQTAWLSASAEQIDAKIDYRVCTVHLNKAEGNLNK